MAYEYCDPIGHVVPVTNVVDSNGGPSLWGSKGVLPAGVRQGTTGDCWFLAVAASLAEEPNRVMKLFENSEYPANGAFKLNFYSAGRPASVVLDDLLPMNPKYP